MSVARELPLAARLLLLLLEFLEVVIESIEGLFPEAAVVFEPVRDRPEWPRREAAGPPLRFAAARDQIGAFQHLQVLRNRRLIEGSRVADRRPAGASRQDAAGVGEGSECRAR